MPDLRVSPAGVELKNPIGGFRYICGFGHEYGEFYDLSEAGRHLRQRIDAGAAGRESASAHC